MKASLSRRLKKLEMVLATRSDHNYGGDYETHFTDAWPGEDYAGKLRRCSEHGPCCLVEWSPLPWTRLKRVIVGPSEPCVLG